MPPVCARALADPPDIKKKTPTQDRRHQFWLSLQSLIEDMSHHLVIWSLLQKLLMEYIHPYFSLFFLIC